MTAQIDLTRLLGTPGLDVGCDECFRLLDRFVELEVERRDAERELPGLRAHLAACPACAEEYESLRALVRLESS
jgi:hypothetical protein